MIYFIADGTKYVKIGYTDDLARRIKDLQCANPHNLYCLLQLSGDIGVERMFHDYFKNYRIRTDNSDTSEWFYICGELEHFLNIDSILEIQQYLHEHFPRKNIMVISKKVNPENELHILKTQCRKQQEKISVLEKQKSNQEKKIKKLQSTLLRLKNDYEKYENYSPMKENAKDFILKLLEDGEIKVATLTKTAEAIGISNKTLERAKIDLKKANRISYRQESLGRGKGVNWYISLKPSRIEYIGEKIK